MSYVVLARKWRPVQFKDLIGQEHIAQTLSNAITNQKISHGYLFTGTRGVGKTTTARILTKALNCEKGPTVTPCGKCESCKGITIGSSMDVLEIDGASNRGVDDIRELREQVKYAPMRGKYKIYIIDEVHMLTKEAFNALLKTLEEPPPNVVFIFATTEIQKVPQTILSRVQRFDFKRISEIKIKQRLEFICKEESIKCDETSLEILSERADGSMRDALSLFDQIYSFSGEEINGDLTRQVLGIAPEEMYDELYEGLINHQVQTCFLIVEKFYNQGIEISEFLNGLGRYFRNLLFSRQDGISPHSLGLSEKHFTHLKEISQKVQEGDLFRFGKLTSDMLFQIKTAPNPRLVIEMGLSKMANLDRVADLKSILKNSSTPNPDLKKKVTNQEFPMPQ